LLEKIRYSTAEKEGAGMKSNAIVFTKPLQVSTGTFRLPDPGPDEILTRTLFSGVSTGTELRVLRGKQPNTAFPLIPGYENVGEVLAVGTGVREIQPGERVFHAGSRYTGPFCRAWGAHAAHAVVGVAEAVPVPEGVSSRDAVYTKTAAIAYHGIQRARVRAGETVAIVGQGLIGHLAAQVAKARGAVVIAIDPIPARLEAALRAGVDHILNPEDSDVAAAVRDLTGDSLDVAMDVTGSAAVVNQTLNLLPVKPWKGPYQPSGRLLILGSTTEPLCFDYHGGLFDIEPDILISRDAVRQDHLDVLAWMAAGKLRPGSIPARVLPWEEAPAGYAALLNRETMRVVYQWRAS
jgi:2-desacetyl-2-hydroxyethyl bacteriochlorophyllide A dehydrogenase